MKKLMWFTTAAVAVGLTFGAPAHAAVTLNTDSGSGFVGKGDVQSFYGWNNKALDTNASKIRFRTQVKIVTVTSWDCVTNQPNGNVRTTERVRRETTQTRNPITTVNRDKKKQVTGFTLTGGVPTTTPVGNDGPTLETCPGGGTLVPNSREDVVTTDPVILQLSKDSGSTFVNFWTPGPTA
jgi:hypothetical protein